MTVINKKSTAVKFDPAIHSSVRPYDYQGTRDNPARKQFAIVRLISKPDVGVWVFLHEQVMQLEVDHFSKQIIGAIRSLDLHKLTMLQNGVTASDVLKDSARDRFGDMISAGNTVVSTEIKRRQEVVRKKTEEALAAIAADTSKGKKGKKGKRSRKEVTS